jgi:hypothetical protein
MGVTDNIERMMEKLIDRISDVFSGGRIQPVEIAKKSLNVLKRNQKVGISQTYVPNFYQIILSPGDFSDISIFEESIVSETKNYLMNYIKKEKLSLLGDMQVTLLSGDKMEKGRFEIECSVKKGKLSGPELEKTIIRQKPLLTHTWLEVKEGPEKGKNFSLSEGENLIGRKEELKVFISDPEISRTHSAIYLSSEEAFLEDMGSTNGTFLNGKSVAKRILIHNGDIISLGDTVMEFKWEKKQR